LQKIRLQLRDNVFTYPLASKILFTGEEFMVSEKTIREKFLILWKYIYPWIVYAGLLDVYIIRLL